jgi:hypothetical protein
MLTGARFNLVVRVVAATPTAVIGTPVPVTDLLTSNKDLLKPLINELAQW